MQTGGMALPCSSSLVFLLASSRYVSMFSLIPSNLGNLSFGFAKCYECIIVVYSSYRLKLRSLTMLFVYLVIASL